MGHEAVDPASHSHLENDVVIVDDLANTLEWLLSSPPPIHQFEEPPVSYCEITIFSAFLIFF